MSGHWTTFPSSYDPRVPVFNFAQFPKVDSSTILTQNMLEEGHWNADSWTLYPDTWILGMGLGNLCFVELQADLPYMIRLRHINAEEA